MTPKVVVGPFVEAPTPEQLKLARRASRKAGLFAPELLKAALKQSFIMLRPDIQWKNPVMFTVEVGMVLTMIFTVRAIMYPGGPVAVSYLAALDVWLLLTVLFANFASSLAEARGKAQADALRQTRQETPANRLRADGQIEATLSTDLKAGDRVVVVAGQFIPGDGEIVEGVASVDESAITGESAPVIREAGGDHSGVTGGTRVLSDRIVVEITASAGNSFLDRMIALVEGAIRQRTPNEIALALVLSAFTLIFLIVTAALWPMAYHVEQYMKDYMGLKEPLHSLGTDIPTLVALLVCLIPTTIGALLAAIGIAGMDRALRANIIAKSGKAVEVAGDVDTLLLDKTGTITIGNRRASQFVPVGECSADELGYLAAVSSIADQTPEGKSILDLYEKQSKASGNEATRSGRSLRRAVRRLHGPDADERRRSAGWPLDPKGRARLGRAIRPAARRLGSRQARCPSRGRRLARGDAAVGLRPQSNRRARRAGRRPQAGNSRPLRPAAADGSAHGHGDGGQSAHRQSHR